MSRISHKTPAVMALINGEKKVFNPIVDEDFKRNVIQVRKPDMADDKEIKINITAELIDEWLIKTIRRFNCCECDVCKAEITVKALSALEEKYVYMNKNTDIKEIKKIKDEYRQNVISELVNICIKRRNIKH